MILSLYMDVHIPRAITEGLRLRGVDVLTAQKDGSGEVSDSDLLTRASSLGRVLFSMDADLLREASRRQAEGGPGCGSPLDGGGGGSRTPVRSARTSRFSTLSPDLFF